MSLRTYGGLAFGCLMAVAASAQTEIAARGSAGQAERQPSFAFVEHSAMRMSQGSWSGSMPMYRYVKEHPGSYVVFNQKGSLYRLDNPERMAEVHKLFEPIQALAAKGEALAHAQSSLAGEQQKLAHSQQSLAKQQGSLASEEVAANDPKDQTRLGQSQSALGSAQGDLGSTQGDLGQQQGDLGTMQGALGRQQAEMARVAGMRMQAIFDGCLADGSCRRVAS